MTKLQQYVVDHWDTLPKSSFGDDEVVIVKCEDDYDGGYGHHSYGGYGIDKMGQLWWAYSSGCSCSGDCGIEHREELKAFQVGGGELADLDPADVSFDSLSVSFSNY